MLKIAFHPDYVLELPPGHRFPMEKYALITEQLLHEGTVSEEHFFEPDIANVECIERVHRPEYVQKLKTLTLSRSEERATGFKQSEKLIQREFRIMEGARKCAEYALENGISMNIAGGTHHAYSNRGEGFCLLNDHAVAAQWLLDQSLVQKVLILDLDVHQGNGTAEIFRHTPEVITFSIHGEHNYPLHKEKSDIDIGLPDGTADQEYLTVLETQVSNVLTEESPDFIFYQSGVDVLKTDKLGRLDLSMEGCKKRDEFVFTTARHHSIPVVCSMGGGYSPEIRTIIEAHANTFRLAQHLFF